jgi:hypothetical protein
VVTSSATILNKVGQVLALANAFGLICVLESRLLGSQQSNGEEILTDGTMKELLDVNTQMVFSKHQSLKGSTEARASIFRYFSY